MNSTEIIEVIAELKVGNFEIMSLVLPAVIGIATIFITFLFFKAVSKQVKQGKEILEYHDKEYIRNGKRITLEIADEFLKDHTEITFGLVENIKKNKISKSDHCNILLLLDGIEQLAIKYYNLDLDLDVLDECVGNYIVPVLNNVEIQKIKKDCKTQLKIDDLYSQLDKFYPLLKEIRKKKSR